MQNSLAYAQAVDLLQRVSTTDGFLAAAQPRDNYCRVWTRDSVVCGLAALLTEDAELIETFKRSLKTIWKHQHPVGFLPSNVDTIKNNISYGGTVGRADTASWAIIGLCMYTLHTGEINFANACKGKVSKAFKLMEAWEFNGKHLMYIPQSADWADEYMQHGYILFDQLLRLWALQLAGKIFSNKAYTKKADRLKQVIQNNFFYRNHTKDWYATNMVHQKETAPKNFWWMGFNPAQIYPQFDLQANALALLLHIGDDDQNKSLLDFIAAEIKNKNQLLASFSPAITKADWQMNELKGNFTFRFRNKPHEFHNGGLWPVWNGWMIAALQLHNKDLLHTRLCKIMQDTISKNNFEMNECYHGQTNVACGVKECAWSAAGIIIAEKGVQLFRLDK